jgi:glycosyltransferase involved in cell wall biosynthesis
LTSPVLVVLPAWNEAHNLPAVIEELRRERAGDVLLVVDDGSTDGTASVARGLGCRVLRMPLHLGYGGAVQAGMKYSLRKGFPVAVTFDADGQHDPRDVQALVDAVAAGANLAIGSRLLAPAAYHGGLRRRAGRRLFATVVRLLTGLPLTDPTSGLKALGPVGQRLFALPRFPDRYPDADALVLARQARLAIAERPATMRPSRNPHSMHSGLGWPFAYAANMLLSIYAAVLGHPDDLGG